MRVTPQTIVTWQGLRAACELDVQGVEQEGLQVAPGKPARLVDPAPALALGVPGTVRGKPWWTQPEGTRQARHAVIGQRVSEPPAGAVVFCSGAWREPWRSLIRQWRNPVVLVTACSDVTVHDEAVKQLVDEGPVAHWFTVQCGVVHPKVTAMPLGTDAWMVDKLADVTPKPTRERDIAIYLNCRTDAREGRDACVEYWRTRPECLMRTFDWTNPEQYVRDLADAHFVVSPPGHGWDCFRTYEALLMGAMPIVLKRDPVSRVVDGLPVVQVNDWAECTPEYLLRAKESIRPCFDWYGLLLDTWVKRMYEASARAVVAA